MVREVEWGGGDDDMVGNKIGRGSGLIEGGGYVGEMLGVLWR